MAFKRLHKSEARTRDILGFFESLIDSGRERASFPDTAPRSAYDLLFWVGNHIFPWWLILDDGKAAGCAYITDLAGRCGRCHFAFLPGADPLAMGRFILSSVLHDRDTAGEYIVDTLVGVTPAENRGAVSLAERCGAVLVGEIPGFYFVHDKAENQPAIIAYYTREMVPAEWGDNHG